MTWSMREANTDQVQHDPLHSQETGGDAERGIRVDEGRTRRQCDDERPNRYAIKASGWTVFGIWPDTEHGLPGCFYGIPVRSLIMRAQSGMETQSGYK